MPAEIKITKRAIDRLETDGTDRFYWDRELPGFGVRVRASGRKFFVAQYRSKGRSRRMTLGPVTAFAPEDARRRAMALLSEAKAGGDPAAQRDADRKAATVKALGERFLDEYVPAHCKPSTAYEYRRSVELFIDPRIGRRKVAEIQRSDIAELHHGLRKTPYQANRTLGVLSKMFDLAEMWGLRPDGSNPCLHVKRFKEEKPGAVPERRGVPAPGRGPRRNPRRRLRDPFGGRGDPAADAHGLPAFGNPDATLGACRSGGWRAAVARHQDWRARGAAGALGGAASGIAAARGGQPVGDRRQEAG